MKADEQFKKETKKESILDYWNGHGVFLNYYNPEYVEWLEDRYKELETYKESVKECKQFIYVDAFIGFSKDYQNGYIDCIEEIESL